MIKSFKDHLKNSGKVIWGEDFRKFLSDEQPGPNEESGVAYSLWRTRKTASTLDYNRKHDKRQFMYEFKKSTKALGNFFRNAVILRGGKLKYDTKPGIAQQFIELFPEVDPESVLEILGVPLLWPDLSEREMTELFFKGLEIREIATKVLAKKNEST
jgi:hypothetical protein